MQIEQDKVVSFHYELKLDGGETIDSSIKREEPLTFLAGHGQIIPGLESELIGMESGDKKSIRVTPENAYGVRDDRLVQTYPKEKLPDDIDYQKGKVLQVQNKDGRPMEVLITNVTDEKVTLDLNHPLAGEHLNFEVEVTEIRDATEEELDHGHSH